MPRCHRAAAPAAAPAACRPHRCRRRQPPAVASAGGEGSTAPSSSSSSSSGSGRAAELDRLLYGTDVPLSELQARLEAAVEEEDYELAAQLRDVLQ